MSSYRLIEAEKTSFPIQLMCRMLGVWRSGYYDWRDRPPSRRSREDTALTEKVREIHRRSRETYGSPRVHAELRALGTRCGRKRVERLMQEAGLRGCVRGRRKRTTRRSGRAIVAGGKASCSSGLHPPRRPLKKDRRVGDGEPSQDRDRRVDALQMAIWRRKPAPGLVHHSDQGVQYTALSFSERLREVGITPSMGRTGSALDNAMAESFVSTLKAELVSRMEFPTRQAAKTAIFEYLETFYNTRRLHSSLGYRSPADFEEDRMREARVA